MPAFKAFHFKKFSIFQEKVALPLNIESVAFGAWLAAKDLKGSLLEIGAGNGVLSLMMAQQNDALCITAIEPDKESIEHFRSNLKTAQFCYNINVVEGDLQHFEGGQIFDNIVCNPPFYDEDTRADDTKRNKAKHINDLSFELLIGKSAGMLGKTGRLYLLIPAKLLWEIEVIAMQYNLYINEIFELKHALNKTAKRCFVSLSAQSGLQKRQLIVLYDTNGKYHPTFRQITREFYLN